MSNSSLVLPFLLSFVLSYAVLLHPFVGAATVSFTILMPNSTYPGLGEFIQGTLTYSDTADPHNQTAAYGPTGHVISSMTGTRSVWVASASANTSYHLHSTSNILGVLPINNRYWEYNSTINGLQIAPGFIDGVTVYDTILGSYYCNSTEYPGGICAFPVYFVGYNQFYYPSWPDHMDFAGWMLILDRAQPGNVNITGNPGYSQYPFTVNIFSNNGDPAMSGDISDNIGYPPNNPLGLSSAIAGYNGVITVAGPSVKGDPQFIGLRGQEYQVHGIDGVVYNLISDMDLQVNARFVFLSAGRCPIIEGVPDSNCWSHPGSYIGQLSFQQVVNGTLYRALITSGPASRGFSNVQMDGEALTVGSRVDAGSFSVLMSSSFRVTITSAEFAFELTNSDMFINEAVQPLVPLSQLRSHGLLGQTHRAQAYESNIRYIEGMVDDYAISDNDIFGSDFVFNRFQRRQ